MRGGGFPHPLFIYYHTLRILSTSLQKSLCDFRLGYNRLIINISIDIFLYELRHTQKFSKTSYPILIYAAHFNLFYYHFYISLFIIPYPHQFCQPTLVQYTELTYWQKSYSYIYIYISPFIIPQIIVFVNMVVSCGIFF